MIVCLHVPCSLCFAGICGFTGFRRTLAVFLRKGKRHRKSLDRGKSRAATTCLGGQKLCACASVYASRTSIARFAAALPHVFFPVDGKSVKTRRRASVRGPRREPHGQSPLNVRQKATAQNRLTQNSAGIKPYISYLGLTPRFRHTPSRLNPLRCRASLTCQSPTLQRFH